MDHALYRRDDKMLIDVFPSSKRLPPFHGFIMINTSSQWVLHVKVLLFLGLQMYLQGRKQLTGASTDAFELATKELYMAGFFNSSVLLNASTAVIGKGGELGESGITITYDQVISFESNGEFFGTELVSQLLTETLLEQSQLYMTLLIERNSEFSSVTAVMPITPSTTINPSTANVTIAPRIVPTAVPMFQPVLSPNSNRNTTMPTIQPTNFSLTPPPTILNQTTLSPPTLNSTAMPSHPPTLIPSSIPTTPTFGSNKSNTKQPSNCNNLISDLISAGIRADVSFRREPNPRL